MSANPINLLLRFLLELAALFAIGYWGWTRHEGIWVPVLGIGLPLIAAAIWGIFRVPGDPREAPVAVAGPVRLLIEAVFFISAVALLAAANQPAAATVLGVLLVLHYLASYDRVLRLLRRG